MKLIDYKEAASRLAVPIGTLRVMVSRRTVPHVRLGARTVKFIPADLDRWIETRRAELPLLIIETPEPRENHAASKEHEEAIGRIWPQAGRLEFTSTLLRLTGVELSLDGRVVPDAFEFDCSASCLSLYEVEKTNEISERKFAKLTLLRDRLLLVGWSLRLFAAAASSNGATEIKVDTGEMTPGEIDKLIRSNHVRFVLP